MQISICNFANWRDVVVGRGNNGEMEVEEVSGRVIC